MNLIVIIKFLADSIDFEKSKKCLTESMQISYDLYMRCLESFS
jgi:hypothetical protein